MIENSYLIIAGFMGWIWSIFIAVGLVALFVNFIKRI